MKLPKLTFTSKRQKTSSIEYNPDHSSTLSNIAYLVGNEFIDTIRKMEELESTSKFKTGQIAETSSRIIQKISESENLQRVVEILEDYSSDAMMIVDRFGYIMSVNPAALKMFEYTSMDLADINIRDIIPLFEYSDKSELYKDMTGFKRDSSEFNIEVITNLITTRSVVSSVVEKRYLTIIKDVSYKHDLIKQNKELGSIVDSLINNSPNPVYHKNLNLRYIGCNRLFEELAGYPFNSIIQKTVFDIFPADIAVLADKKDKELIYSKNPKVPQIYTCEVKNKFSDKKLEVMVYNSAIIDSDDNVSGILGTIIDLTDYLKAKKSAKMFEDALNYTVSPIFIIDSNDIVIFANKIFFNILDMTTDVIIGKSIINIIEELGSTKVILKKKDNSKISYATKCVEIPYENEEANNYLYILSEKLDV